MKYLRNVLSALIQNFDTVEEVIETSANSTGSALRENEKYLDSIQGRTDQFNNAVQALWSNLIDSDVVKGLMSIATALVKILDKLNPLNVAFVGLFAFLEKKYGLLGSLFKPAEESLEGLRKKLTIEEEFLAQTKEKNKARATKMAERKEKAKTNVAEKKEKFDEKLKEGADTKAKLQSEKDALETKRTERNNNLEQLKQTKHTERDELQKKIELEQQNIADIAENGVKTELYDFIDIDTSDLDDEIESVKLKLSKAEEELARSQTMTVDDYIMLGSTDPLGDYENSIATKNSAVETYKEQLEGLQLKKEQLVSSGIAIEVTESSKENLSQLENQLQDVDNQLLNISNSLTGTDSVDINRRDDTLKQRDDLQLTTDAKAYKRDLMVKSMQEQGMTPEQIQGDSKIKQLNAEIDAGRIKLEAYNDELREMDILLQMGNDDPSGEISKARQELDDAYAQLGKVEKAELDQIDKATKRTEKLENNIKGIKGKIASLEPVDTFDAEQAKKSLKGKKMNKTKRVKKLQNEGKTFDEISEDPKIKQWTQEIKDGEAALESYGTAVKQTDTALKGQNAATVAATAAEVGKTNAERADAAATTAGAAADNAATGAEEINTATTWKQVWAITAKKSATFAETLETMKQVIAYKLATSAAVKKAVADQGLTTAELVQLGITKLLTLGMKGLAMSFIEGAKNAAAFIVSLGPVVWISVGVVAAIAAIAGIIAATTKSSAELREELDDLRSQMSDISSEIDSLNGELETTQERMAELLAKDSLSFTEKEELDNLQKQNNELERQIYLLEQKEKRLQEQAQNTFDDLMKKQLANAKRDMDNDGEKDDVFDRSLERRTKRYRVLIANHKIAQQELVDAERELEEAQKSGDQTAINKAKRKVKRKQDKVARKEKRRNNKKKQIDEEITQYLADAEGIDYESADEETKAYLDYINNTVGRLSIIEGDAQAKSMEIKRIFDKHNLSGEMDKLVKQLKEDPGDQTTLDKIREKCETLGNDLYAVGLSAQDAYDYFTMSSNSTAGSIMQQYGAAVQALRDLKAGEIQIDDLVSYDSEAGEATANDVAIAEKLRGVSPEVRDQFAAIVEEIKEGAENTEGEFEGWDAAIKKLELQGMQAVLENTRTELEAANKLAFPDLEISGWLDSVDELKGAFESLSSTMDLINSAREEFNEHGRVSMKTTLDLMASTDNWNEILEVNNGIVSLNAKAEESLIQSKLTLIRTNIEASLAQVQTDIALMQGALNATEAGNTFTEGFTEQLTKAQGVLVGLKAGWDAFWSGEDVASAFNSAYSKTIEKATPSEASLAELEQREAELQKKLKMLESIDTTQEFKSNYDFDKGNDSDGDGVDDDAFQKEMDYWENRIAANQAKYNQLQNEIDLLEAKGQKAHPSFYLEQIELEKLEKGRKDLLEGQRDAAKAHLDTLGEGSEKWWEVASALNDIENELGAVDSSIVGLQDAIGEIDTYKFEEFNTRLDNIVGKLGTIRDLIAPNGEEDWFDDEGQWTEDGVAVLGTYVQELETYKQGLDETKNAMTAFNNIGGGAEWAALTSEQKEAYANQFGIHSEQEYYDKQEELINQQYDFASSISDTGQSIVGMYESSIDAVEEYTDTLIESYNDYIDSVKEALDAERDLYDFKKDVQKQSKDIAAIERRIASLSGSTNKSDIAERRKLEQQLYDSRESLNDSYYDHAQQSQQDALESEVQAYEDSMTKFVEGLRTSLEEATLNMDEFLMGVTSMVMYNADTVLAKYQETNLPLTSELTNPWEAAKTAVGDYSGNALDLMDQWTKEDGFFAKFNTTGTENLQSPWTAGSNAASAFKSNVESAMDSVLSKIQANVQEAKTSLTSLTSVIKTTDKRPPVVEEPVEETTGDNTDGDTGDTGGDTSGDTGGDVGDTAQPELTEAQKMVPQITRFGSAVGSGMNAGKKGDNGIVAWDGKEYSVQNSGTTFGKSTNLYKAAVEHLKFGDRQIFGYQGGVYGYLDGVIQKLEGRFWSKKGYNDLVSYAKGQYTSFAKGTMGTSRDQWAITDEPQFGDELTMYATPEGKLSFMRAGSTVIPADITANLVEWGKLNPDMLNVNGTPNINMISNAINKPELNISFESLVKAENITEETLPAVKKLVTQELNRFTKELNYALKGKGAR